MMRRRCGCVWAAVAAAASLTACTRPTEPMPSAAPVERARVAMGSELRLTAWTDDEPAAVSAFDEVFAEFDRLESLLSAPAATRRV